MAILGIDNVGVSVRDIKLVAGFFEDKVGVKVEMRLQTSPPSAHIYVGQNYLFMFQTTSQELPNERQADVTHNPTGLDHIAFTCDNIDETYNSMFEKGVEFSGEPQSYPIWGIKMVGFKDPEGNWYYLVQNLS